MDGDWCVACCQVALSDLATLFMEDVVDLPTLIQADFPYVIFFLENEPAEPVAFRGVH